MTGSGLHTPASFPTNPEQAAGARGRWPVAVFAAVSMYLALRVPTAEFLLSSNDQGYQMALGMAVAHSQFPGLDFITQYGPAVAFMSCFAFTLSGSAVGEMVVSILGYASAISLGSELVRRSAGWKWAAFAALGMLFWLPRFYKWYYCLLPLLGVAAAEHYVVAISDKTGRWTLLGGWSLLIGLAALFRYDLGLEGIVFGMLAVIATRYARRGARWAAPTATDAAVLALGSLMIPGLYATWILLARDTQHLTMFARSIYDGATDTIDYYAIAPFRFDPGAALSTANALAFLQVAVPLTCLAGCGIGWRDITVLPNRPAAGYTLFCTSLTGIGIYPQAVHRADPQHLLQAGYPFIIVLTLLLARFAAAFRLQPAAVRLPATAWFAVTLAAALRLVPATASDLGPGSVHSARRWSTLASLPASRPLDPTADMAMALRRFTAPDAAIFLVMTPTDMPMLFFGQRYQAGIFPVYESGMFSDANWLARNRDALRASPPDYLVVPEEASNDPAPFMPDLLSEWRSSFTTTLYRNARYRLLTRQPAPQR
jgi:hypothetical protein